MKEKNVNLSFDGSQKETFKERLRELLGHRSLQSASNQWGVPKSTLNNYLYRGSSPRISVIKKIAEVEKVDSNWLIYGLKKEEHMQQETVVQQYKTDKTASIKSWVDILEVLTEQEAELVLRTLKREGAKALLNLVNNENQCIENKGKTSIQGHMVAVMFDALNDAAKREILRDITQAANPDLSGTIADKKVADEPDGKSA